MKQIFVVTFVGFLAALWSASARAESQDSDYKGVTDPFSDPTNYEFAEDEKEDKEFFHLGRYLMIGFDTGVGIFTGELGRTAQPGFYVGLKLLYFFDKSFALEAAGHYSQHSQIVIPDAAKVLELNVTLIPITAGFRYYFDTKAAPKAIAIANPYLAFGAGAYIRQQQVLQDTASVLAGGEATSSAFGGYAGGGVEFSIYRRHLYLGIDLRYHLVFFNDETQKFFVDGDRSGDYFTGVVGITYNF